MWPFSAAYPEVPLAQIDGKIYDYIVVGGGTAGCAVASRLSEDPSVSVLVLEQGGVKDSMLSRIPLMSQNFLMSEALQVVTDRWSEPVPAANNFQAKFWGAEGLGGASRINGMVFTRGPPGEYNAWAEQLGLDDWRWERVEPYFRRSENAVAHPGSAKRGHEGPIELRKFKPLFEWGPFIDKAATGVGLPIIEDGNDPEAPAMGMYRLDIAVDSHSQRKTSYHAYLNKQIALARRRHLTVCTGAVASRLDIDGKAGLVRGVYVQPAKPGSGKGSGSVYVKACREVILCCGAYKTPQLLLLSGVGPRAQLESHDIPVVRDLPAVGTRLADHYAVPVLLELPRRETLHILEQPLLGLWHILLWLFAGAGLMSRGSNTSTIFVRSDALADDTLTVRPDADMDIAAPANVPDVEVMIMPVTSFKREVPDRTLFSIYPALVQPFSTGAVELRDTDPRSHPRITHPMFRDARDLPVARKAVRFAMRLAAEFQTSGYPYPAPLAFAPGNNLEQLAEWEKSGKSPAWDPNGTYTLSPSPSPPPAPAPTEGSKKGKKEEGKTWATVTDAEIDAYIAKTAVVSLHPMCTAPMANDPEKGVVDQRLRVHGIRNLRVADTSALPRVLSTHTMWPAIMFGERCADFVREDSARKSKTV